MTAQLSSVMATGQGPQGSADLLALISGQQTRIGALEQRVLQEQQQGAQAAQGYEDRLFSVSRDRDTLSMQLAVSQGQIEANNVLLQQRQAQVEELQRKQVQDAEQIAIGLREIGLLSAQVQREREQVQLLTGQLTIATRNIEQLTLQMQSLEQMHRGTLAMVQKQQNQGATFVADVASWAWDLIWKGVRLHPSSAYHNM